MYAKLFGRITESSLMEEEITTRYVFVMFLAMADPRGYVIGTDLAISRRLNMPLRDFEAAVTVLLAPDPNSNSLEEEGRRIVSSDTERGYRIVNYVTYRNTRDEDSRREYQRNYRSKYRADGRDKNRSQPGHSVNSGQHGQPQSTQAEAEAEAEADERSSSESRTDSDLNVSKEAFFACNGKLTPLAREWNHLCDKLPAVREVNPERRRREAVRLREHPLSWWQNVFKLMNSSNFLTGGSDRGWRADYDWIIRNGTNALAVFEGKYGHNGNGAIDRAAKDLEEISMGAE